MACDRARCCAALLCAPATRQNTPCNRLKKRTVVFEWTRRDTAPEYPRRIRAQSITCPKHRSYDRPGPPRIRISSACPRLFAPTAPPVPWVEHKAQARACPRLFAPAGSPTDCISPAIWWGGSASSGPRFDDKRKRGPVPACSRRPLLPACGPIPKRKRGRVLGVGWYPGARSRASKGRLERTPPGPQPPTVAKFGQRCARTAHLRKSFIRRSRAPKESHRLGQFRNGLAPQ